MALLIDLFGYLSIVLHGLTVTAQSMALGAILFLALLARPLAPMLGTPAEPILRGTVRIAAWSAAAMVLCEGTTVALQTAVLVGTIDLPVTDILSPNFAIAGLIKTTAATMILLVERLRARPDTSILSLRRFAEVEIGIGITIFFAAASLTSVPPAVDLTQDRASWQEIRERNMPQWPRLTSPDHDKLALPALQEKLDAEAAQHTAPPQVAFVPGSDDLPPRNAADIA